MNDSRLRELAEEIHVEGQGRCAICFWPLAESAEKGCVRGNCSMRGESGEYERHSHRAKVEAIIKTLKASTVLAAALAEPASDLRAKLASLRELSEKATAGEWHGDPEPYVEYIWGPNEEMVAQIRGYGAGLPMRWNRDFIVACVNAVRAILKGKD